jgi:hypothetical protein
VHVGVFEANVKRPTLRQSAWLNLDDDICGVAQLDDKIFVVSYLGNNIHVFGPDFEQHSVIKVDGLQRPTDLAVCTETRHIYVANSSKPGCVWRVSVDDGAAVKWIPNSRAMDSVRPFSLSVTSQRLLVTPCGSEQPLMLYGAEGELIQRVSLPRDMNVYHAVETKNKSFILLYRVPHHGVSEVDSNGRVLRVCDHQLNGFRYLALNVDGHVIVADAYNNRVLLLNENLKLERVLLSDVWIPCRLSYAPETGQLLVGGRKHVNLFRLA